MVALELNLACIHRQHATKRNRLDHSIPFSSPSAPGEQISKSRLGGRRSSVLAVVLVSKSRALSLVLMAHLHLQALQLFLHGPERLGRLALGQALRELVPQDDDVLFRRRQCQPPLGLN